MLKFRLLFFSIAFLVNSSAFAKLSKTEWSLDSGTLTYHGVFPLKKFDGVSKSAKGKGRCEKGQCHFLVAVPVKTFDSGDSNRDSHMLEVTKAATYPMVAVEVDCGVVMVLVLV